MSTVVPRDLSAPMTIAPQEPKQTASIEGITPSVADTPEVKEDTLSPKFAALAKKERAIREQARAIHAERAAIAAEKAEVDAYKARKARLAQGDYSVLAEEGLNGDQLTQYLLNQPGPQDQKFMDLQKKIENMEAAQARAVEEAANSTKQQYQQALTQIKNDVTALVDTDETFEMVKSMNAHDAVVALIEEEFKESGKILSVDDAAREVEEYLIEQAMTLARAKKIQARMNPPPAQPPQKTQSTQKTPTLTNRIVPSSAKTLTDKERRERAIAAFNGTLK